MPASILPYSKSQRYSTGRPVLGYYRCRQVQLDLDAGATANAVKIAMGYLANHRRPLQWTWGLRVSYATWVL